MQWRRPQIPRQFYDPLNRARSFAGFGATSHRSSEAFALTQTGTPGNLLDSYSEDMAWGQGQEGGAIAAPPLIGGGPAVGPITGLLNAPFGTILGPDGVPIQWKNPTSVANFPIQASTAVNPPPISPLPVLSLNYARNLLVIQNNSVAPTAGDVAPTLFVAFNAQPQLGFALGLPPGVGITFDIICPRDSVFVAWGTFSNAGASVVIQGVVVQGTYSP
jgi:hypothetical protein